GRFDLFSKAMLLQVPASLRAADLTAALQALLDHHDALRLRLGGRAPGEASLEIALPGTVAARDCVRRVEVAGLAAEALQACIAEEALAAQLRLSPAAGVMVQAVWFDAGADAGGRLLLCIHH